MPDVVVGADVEEPVSVVVVAAGAGEVVDGGAVVAKVVGVVDVVVVVEAAFSRRMEIVTTTRDFGAPRDRSKPALGTESSLLAREKPLTLLPATLTRTANTLRRAGLRRDTP